MESNVEDKKFFPGSDSSSEEIFNYPYIVDEKTVEYLQQHNRIMFIVRGFPGTGKNSLANLIRERYPSAVIFSADNYFDETFTSKERNSHSLKLSHEYCHKKVAAGCSKNLHPIIVKNTHVKKSEVQIYFNLATEHKYTVIIAATNNKFHISPKTLASSNTKCLNECYFKKRMKQWEEIPPFCSGWFLSPADSNYLLQQLQIALDAMLGHGKFCRILNAYDTDTVLKYYKGRELLYCVAACCRNNAIHQLQSHFSSRNVSENFGQSFEIVVEGYLVTSEFVFAVVQLDATMQRLRYFKGVMKKSKEDCIDSLTKIFERTSISNYYRKYHETVDLDVKFEGAGQTAIELQRGPQDVIDTKSCSFIHLAQSLTAPTQPLQPDLFFDLLTIAADKTGNIHVDEFQELEDGFKVYGLTNDAWLVKPPNKIALRTVYTGLYV